MVIGLGTLFASVPLTASPGCRALIQCLNYVDDPLHGTQSSELLPITQRKALRPGEAKGLAFHPMLITQVLVLYLYSGL